jgi:hypothetical protein
MHTTRPAATNVVDCEVHHSAPIPAAHHCAKTPRASRARTFVLVRRLTLQATISTVRPLNLCMTWNMTTTPDLVITAVAGDRAHTEAKLRAHGPAATNVGESRCTSHRGHSETNVSDLNACVCLPDRSGRLTLLNKTDFTACRGSDRDRGPGHDRGRGRSCGGRDHGRGRSCACRDHGRDRSPTHRSATASFGCVPSGRPSC